MTARRRERDAWVEGHWQVEVRREREREEQKEEGKRGRPSRGATLGEREPLK